MARAAAEAAGEATERDDTTCCGGGVARVQLTSPMTNEPLCG